MQPPLARVNDAFSPAAGRRGIPREAKCYDPLAFRPPYLALSEPHGAALTTRKGERLWESG
jgi:hypothetical protein